MTDVSNQIKKKLIIWPVDPTQKPSNVKKVIQELKIWSKKLNCEIQPVSILSKAILNLPVEINFPWKMSLTEIAQRSFNLQLTKNNCKINEFRPLELIFINSISNRKMALELAKYAEKKHASLIITNTHTKKALSPFHLGSFTESLVTNSTVPVLLLNPKAIPTPTIRSVLFPTDFNQESKNALINIEPWVKAFDAKVILFNQVETPNIYTSEFDGTWQTQSFNIATIMKDVEIFRKNLAKKWSELLSKENIKNLVLVQQQRKNLSNEILDAAKKNKASMIALSSHSDRLTQIILGSTTRDLILNAKCPILIFHRPKGIRKHPKKMKTLKEKSFHHQKSHSSNLEVHHG